MIRYLFSLLFIGLPIFAQAGSLPECAVKFEMTEYNENGFVLRVGDQLQGYPIMNYHDDGFTTLKELFAYRKHLVKSGVCKMPTETPHGTVCSLRLGANDINLYVDDKRVKDATFVSREDQSVSAVNAMARTLVNEQVCQLQSAQDRPICTVHKDFHAGHYTITTPVVEGSKGEFTEGMFSWQVGSGEQTREAINAQMDRAIEYWTAPLVFSGACRKVINAEHPMSEGKISKQ